MKLSTPQSLIELLGAVAVLCVPACVMPDMDVDGATDGDTDSDPTMSSGTDTEGTGDCTLVEQSDVDADLDLPAGCYYAETALRLQGTTLSMQPGVDFTFGAASGLTLTGGAVISAVGTPDDPVMLHGENDDPANWTGISLSGAPSSQNRLESVIVEGAAAVTVSADSKLAVVASEFSGSAEIGLEAQGDAEITVTASTFIGHERPLVVGMPGAAGVGGDNVFMDNDNQSVLVTGNEFSDAATWAALGVPWELASRFSIRAALTLEPGVTLMLPQAAWIIVTTDGQLNAVGTAEAPITFTGVEPEVGYWFGMQFESNSSNNVLDHVLVEYAGGDGWFGGGESNAALYVPAEGRLTLRNSTIADTEGYGLLGADNAQLGDFSNNAFVACDRPMKIDIDLGGMIGSETIFENNTEQFVQVGFGNNDRISTAQTWQALSVPWRATTRFFVEAPWTLSAGVVFEGAQDSEFSVEDGGSIHAAGTAEAPVTFTSPESIAGYWKGIGISSGSPDNLLENTVIEYAGSSGWIGGEDQEAAVFVNTEGVLALDAVVIRDSAGNAVSNRGAITCSNVTFETIAKDILIGTGTGTCA